MTTLPPPEAIMGNDLPKLNATETRILGFLADGYSQVQVALLTRRSPSSVKAHIRRAKGKLGVKSTTRLVLLWQERTAQV